MGVSVAAGRPDYAGNFIPELWSSTMVIKYYEANLLEKICNTTWQGEIKKTGDTVHIRQIPDVVIKDGSKGGVLAYEVLNEPLISLTIDQYKYWGFTVDDVDAYQSDLDLMDKWGVAASNNLKEAVNEDVLQYIPTEASAYNQGNSAGYRSSRYKLGATGSPIPITTDNAVRKVTELVATLKELNIPTEGLNAVIPPWYGNILVNSDLKNAMLTGDSVSPIRNGMIGKINGVTIYESNQLLTATDTVECYYAILCHESAVTFASQIVDTERLRDKDIWGDFIRGRNVYGRKVVKPEGVAVLYCKPGE
jgi:hypothetical protein